MSRSGKSELQLLIDTCLRDTWRCLTFSREQHVASLKSSFAQGQFYPLPKGRSNSLWEGTWRPLGTLIRWWKSLSDSFFFFFEQSRSSGCVGLQKRFLKCPLTLSENNTGLAGRSDMFSVFVPYPGHFADEQRPAWCVMQLLAKVQMPKSGPPSQSIAELLAFVQSDKHVETREGRSGWTKGKQST